MSLTIEVLKQKLAIMIAQKDQMAANLNATLGSIQLLEGLIREAENPPPKAEGDKPTVPQGGHNPGKAAKVKGGSK